MWPSWLLKRPAFWAGVVLCMAGWQTYIHLRPRIEFVPVSSHNGALTILGHGFGDRQKDSYLAFGHEIVREVKDWSNRRVVATPPDGSSAGGHVRVVKQLPFYSWVSKPACFVVRAKGLPSRPYGYETPVEAESPWPLFRRDRRNTGRSPIAAAYHGDKPWSFRTGKGIFSTPVIGADNTIYVGSADHCFYALNPDGAEKWRFETGELIDSAAALHRDGTVTLISGDRLMYHLRTDGEFEDQDARVLWTFDVAAEPGAGYVDWWEGNVAIGYDGTIYAGNTNWNYYAIDPGGTVKWKHATGSNNWSMAAHGDDGTIYWGSLDTLVRGVAPDGVGKWTKRTLGFIAASAALGSDGTVYIGSFDSYMYALDGATGAKKWKFKTDDHIYSSAALGADPAGKTTAIYFGSTDGIFYALDTRGELLWSYDTGDPIRSSPALGEGPDGEGAIVYFGSGNGKLYALNADDGTRRWSFDTTPDDPELRDRNDLNASPALGKTGVYIAGEHGYVWYVPYDYPLHAEDARCDTAPGEDMPDDMADLFYVTSGGTTSHEAPETIPAATILTFRLVVREDGQTLDARMKEKALDISVEPSLDFSVEPSADGHYLHLIPEGFLKPGEEYTFKIAGGYYTGGFDFGNLTVGGRKSGGFSATFTFRASDARADMPGLTVAEDTVTAFEWTRMAVPLPSMMPSLNQIGFDYFDCIMSVIEIEAPGDDRAGKFILWMTGAYRDDDGRLVADPEPDFLTPLNGFYEGDHFILRNRDFKLVSQGIDIPFNVLEMRGQFGPDLVVESGATVYADARVLSIPDFGPLMALAGLANNVYEKLVFAGTFITRPCGESPANRRPQGVSVGSIEYATPSKEHDGSVAVAIQLEPGAAYPLAQHRPAIFLIDTARTEAIFLDYYGNLTATADSDGNLAAIRLTIPAGLEMPSRTEAVVILDAFPLHRTELTSGI